MHDPSDGTTPDLEALEDRAALGGLPEAHREVLILRYWEDMTYGEISLLVGIPVGTVRSRLFHAKAELRSCSPSCCLWCGW